MIARLRLIGSLITTTAVVSPWIGATVSATTEPLDTNLSDENSNQTVRKNAVGSLCQPITGSGKSAGVPIAIEDSNGQLLTDVSGLTFELRNDSGVVHDVTQFVTTPVQQPIVEGAVANQYGGWVEPGLDDLFTQVSLPASEIQSSLNTGLSNPGYFFLNCTPDKLTTSTKFPEGTTLNAIRNGTVVASGSVAERSASYLPLGGSNSSNPSSSIRPATGDTDSMAILYEEYLKLVPVRFRLLFAEIAILQLSNSTYGNQNGTWRCWDDLFTFDGTTWSWTPVGQDFIDELTSESASQWPILRDRTQGIGVTDPNIATACDIGLSTLEDDLFINYLAAQLLLIDGPAGRVPSAISGDNSQNNGIDTFLRPAVRLVAVTNPDSSNSRSEVLPSATTTTTTTAVSPTKQNRTQLPSTGLDPQSNYWFGLAIATLGGALVVLRRRISS
jgi:LPXTG-motif cell wall-anchored protein